MADNEARGGSAPGVRPERLLFGRFGFWMAMVGLVSVTSGLAFGYDQGVIGGALNSLVDDLDLGSFGEGVVTSLVAFGALFGALFGGRLADGIGRKRSLILAAVLFIVGGILQAIAPTIGVLILGRFIIGFGVGIATVAAPLYASESAPASVRGRFVSGYQLAITIGILSAQFADFLLTGSGNWRLMLGLAAAPGVVLLVVVLPVPKSPRWLLEMGREEEAHRSLTMTRGARTADESIPYIKAELEREEPSSWADLFEGVARKALLVAVGLAIFQQVTGINAIIYYSDSIFEQAGFTSMQDQTAASLISVGVVNVLATFIAVAFVDVLGRRPLMLAGLVGMFAGLFGLTVTFFWSQSPNNPGESIVGFVMIVWLVVFIASFAFSLGPVVWTVIAEIFPTKVRARGVALATSANWLANFVVALIFPDLLSGIGASATFGILSALTIVAFVWIWRVVPETKGKTLEQISEDWRAQAQ